MLIKIVTAAVLLAHGIGHAMAPQAAFLPPGAFPRTAAAAVGGMTITSGVGRLMAVIWIVPLLGFLAGTYGLWTGADWWRPVLAAAAIVSIAVVLPWWSISVPGPIRTASRSRRLRPSVSEARATG